MRAAREAVRSRPAPSASLTGSSTVRSRTPLRTAFSPATRRRQSSALPHRRRPPGRSGPPRRPAGSSPPSPASASRRRELNTGLRRAEAAGLRWSDVDFTAGVIRVQVQRTTEGYKVVEREPKTASGRRRVPVDPGVMVALRAWKKRQTEERLSYGPAYADTELVFTREDGSGWHPQSLRHAFTWACKRAQVPVLRFHDLRHTAATLALEAGVHPKVVQERLGHASVQITLDTYSHVQESVGKEAAGQIARYLDGDG